MAFGIKSCIVCLTMAKYEEISDRISDVSISSRIEGCEWTLPPEVGDATEAGIASICVPRLFMSNAPPVDAFFPKVPEGGPERSRPEGTMDPD